MVGRSLKFANSNYSNLQKKLFSYKKISSASKTNFNEKISSTHFIEGVEDI